MAVHGWFASARNRKTGVRKELPGLVKRRQAEARTCLTPVESVAAQAAPQAPVATKPATAAKRPSLLERIARFFRHLFGGNGS
jgi:hypothetical protein